MTSVRERMEAAKKIGRQIIELERALDKNSIKKGVIKFFGDDRISNTEAEKATDALLKGLLISFDGGYLTTINEDEYFEYSQNGGLWTYHGIPSIAPCASDEILYLQKEIEKVWE